MSDFVLDLWIHAMQQEFANPSLHEVLHSGKWRVLRIVNGEVEVVPTMCLYWGA